MNNTGWIKIHRSILDWEWWEDINTRNVFIYCIIVANHQDTDWRGIPIKRGSFLTSIETLSKSVGLTVKQTRRAIEKLKKTKELGITRVSTMANAGSIVTICNYDKYQVLNDTEGQMEGQTEGQQKGKGRANGRATNNEYKNDNNIKENNNSNELLQKKVFVAPSVDEVAAYCRERGNGIDAERFVSYYESIGWVVGKTKMKDWKAAVRTWERKESCATPTQEQPANTPKIEYDRNGNPIKQRKWE